MENAAKETVNVNKLLTLQWGHHFSAMETSFSPRVPGRESMLQWGHHFSAMETCG